MTDDLRVMVCPQCSREHLPGRKGGKGYCSQACSSRANLGVPPKPAPRRHGPVRCTPMMLELARALHAAKGRPMRPRELAVAIGRPPRGPVPYAMRLMQERGVVVRSPRGTYALTALGRAVAEATTEGE